MSGAFTGLDALETAAAAIARAATPSEIFRAVLEGTACGAPRAAIFLLRDRQWKGWGARGHGPLAARALRALALDEDAGWLARLAATEEPWLPVTPGDEAPRFGQAPADDAIGVSVRVGGKAVAGLLAERGEGEDPWHPEALAVLVHVARLRLELDLAWRRLRAADRSRAGEAEAPAPFPTPAAPSPTAQMAPWSEPQPASEGSDPKDDEARRYARLVATDIRLYNEEAVAQGRAQRDLARRLGDQLQRGRESFERRFPELGPHGRSILRDSYVQVLAGGDASLIPAD